MALDRQRILGELGSVMKQLQNADCGCLGKLFGTSQQAPQPMTSSPLPTCGGCRRACCHGHGCGQYYPQNSMNQPTSNVNYMSMSNPSQQPMSGNLHGFGPQIVNMMKSNHSKLQNVAALDQGQMQGQIQQQMQPQMQEPMQGQMQDQMNGQLTGPIVIDAPQSPHGKVGLTPLTPPSMIQQGAFYSNIKQGDVARHTQNQLIPQPNTGNLNPAAYNMLTPQSNVNGWAQQNMASNYQTPTSHSNPHGKHSEGIAKFHNMFPGVKQGMGGDLGFDPMAIAIQMNPDNHLQSAMNSMNKIMNDSKGIDQMLHKIPEPQTAVLGNAMQPISPVTNGSIQHNALSEQVAQRNVSQMANQPPISNNTAPNQVTSIQQHAINPYPHPIPQQTQQIYAAAGDLNAANQQIRYENNQQIVDQQQYQYQQGIADAPNLPVTYEEQAEEILETRPAEPTGYPNQLTPQQMIKEPIFPVDTSRNQIYALSNQQKNNDYVYNTLGQPVEMLPAKMYHPPEPSLPQTLSPQPAPVKPRSYAPPANVKATVSKTSLLGNKPVGKTPSRAQLQHIYNQYKGSQSFTQQNVRRPGEGTYSDGRLNIPQPTKTPPVPVERVGGDTIVNNPPQNEDRTNKVKQVIGQIGDVAATKPAGDTQPVKGSPDPVRKCRNGLQDMVFSSYPSSAAWTFHGHGRNNSYSPTRRFQNRRYL